MFTVINIFKKKGYHPGSFTELCSLIGYDRRTLKKWFEQEGDLIMLKGWFIVRNFGDEDK